MAQLLTDRIEAPTYGLDLSAAPDAVPKGYARELENFLVDNNGKVPLRGSIYQTSDLSIGTSEILTGAWSFQDKLLLGFVSKHATAQREPWTAPYVSATAAQLAEPATTMKHVDTEASTVSNVAAGQDTVICGEGARIGSYVYGFAYSNATDDDTGNGYYMHRRKILRWDGSTAVPTAYANAPAGGQDVCAHLNRLFVLGGRDVPGGLTAHERNTLYWSDYGGPTADTTAMWQNDVTGLTNKLVVDSDNGDFGTGLAKLGQDLVIFKRHSTHILYGYSDDTFTLRRVSASLGCIDNRSIVETEAGVYFMSAAGYALFNGTTIRIVDEKVRDELLPLVEKTIGDDYWYDGGRVIAIPLPNEYILLSVMRQDLNTAAITYQASYLFHIRTESWVHFTSSALDSTIPTHGGKTLTNYWLTDGSYVAKCNALTVPEASQSYGTDLVESGTGRVDIPATWHSRMIRLSTPGYKAHLHRLMIDYDHQPQGDDSTVGWRVSGYQGDGTQVVSTFQVYYDYNTATRLYRRRHVQDAFSEADDFQLRVEWDGTVGGYNVVTSADVYDCYVEYSPARQRRGPG